MYIQYIGYFRHAVRPTTHVFAFAIPHSNAPRTELGIAAYTV